MTQEKPMRALMAAVNGDWAIQQEWIPRILEIAAREHGGLQAVEAERGEPLEYAYSARIRDGVAVIPVTGPIYRYANLFSSYSGGTSVSILARDFNACLNDPRVDSIMFEINSPGGEVTGISELAQMIYAARGRKPITARVGGMGCSAAYWIASACNEIVIDDTAILGSIGVYATYRDWKKADAKQGLREIKIISSQSPDKCPDPATPEGEKKIQARIDALAQVFVEAVARYRDVSVAEVLSDFGKGDVFVGQGAVEAGLADRLGSFEETLALLVEAHGQVRTPGYTGALHAEEEVAVGDAVAAAGHAGAATADGASVGERGERADAEEDEPPPCPEHPDGCPNGDPCEGAGAAEEEVSANAPVTTQIEEGTTEMSNNAENPSGAAAASQPTVEQLQAQLVELAARAQKSESAAAAAAERVTKLEGEARTGRLTGLAANFAGDKTTKITFMEKLAATFGEDSEELKGYVTDQNAQAEQLRAGGVFRESGSAAAANDKSALGQLNALAATIEAAEKVTSEKAFMLACERNPALYTQYNDEQG